MGPRCLLALGAIAVVIVGCARIPPEAVNVNDQVGQGITTLHQNNLDVINAWEKLGYYIVDERWNDIHDRAAAIYARRAGDEEVRAELDAGTSKEAIIAGIATGIRDEVRARVRAEADKMRETVNHNMQESMKANESITRLLTSANQVAVARATVLERVGEFLPIDVPEIAGFVDDALDAVAGSATASG